LAANTRIAGGSIAVALCALCLPLPTQAGRPLTTEDAAVLQPKCCQLESWLDRSRDATAGWLVPSCDFGTGIEWQVGFARTREAGEARFSEAYAQAKTVFIEPANDGFRVGLVVGVARRPLNENRRGWDHPFLTVPVTSTFGDTAIHANLGWSRNGEARRDATTWALAIEKPVGALTAVAEAFGENTSRPFFRAGMRWTAIADALDLDLTVVTRPGGDRSERYVSLGFTFMTRPFLP
jgi:hypothetical protein